MPRRTFQLFPVMQNTMPLLQIQKFSVCFSIVCLLLLHYIEFTSSCFLKIPHRDHCQMKMKNTPMCLTLWIFVDGSDYELWGVQVSVHCAWKRYIEKELDPKNCDCAGGRPRNLNYFLTWLPLITASPPPPTLGGVINWEMDFSEFPLTCCKPLKLVLCTRLLV